MSLESNLIYFISTIKKHFGKINVMFIIIYEAPNVLATVLGAFTLFNLIFSIILQRKYG